MSSYLLGIEMAPEKYKGIGVVDRQVYLPRQGVLPDDLKVVKRLVPIPYKMNLELAIYSSNTDQQFQVLEQILMLFDPILQVQSSDAYFDWTKITTCELTSIGFDENYEGWGREDSDLVARLFHADTYRLNLHNMPVLHLWHREEGRSQLNKNDLLLDECLKSKRIEATQGLRQLQEPS